MNRPSPSTYAQRNRAAGIDAIMVTATDRAALIGIDADHDPDDAVFEVAPVISLAASDNDDTPVDFELFSAPDTAPLAESTSPTSTPAQKETSDAAVDLVVFEPAAQDETLVDATIKDYSLPFDFHASEQPAKDAPGQKGSIRKKLSRSLSAVFFETSPSIDAVLHRLILSEPLLSEEELLRSLEKQLPTGSPVTRKKVQKALARSNLHSGYHRFRAYMAG
jgi:hypothetical protein